METVQIYYQKYGMVIWPVCVIASSMAILLLVVLPQFSAYVTNKNEINNIKNQVTGLEAKADGLVKIDESKTQGDLRVAFTVLPTDPDIPGAIAVLETLITQSNLTLKDKSYSSSKILSGKDNFQIKFTVDGQLSQVKELFSRLQKSPRVFQIESISAQFNKDGSTIQAEIPFTVYFKGIPTNLATTLDQPVPKLNDQEEKVLASLPRQFQVLAPKVELVNEATPTAKVPPGQVPAPVVPGSPTASSLVPGVDLSQDTSSVPLGKLDPFE